MKIFNIENKKEVVYVHKCDILRLKYINSDLAHTIYNQYKDVINDSNLMEFVRFEFDYEVSFFKKIDWIIDYRKINELSTHMLEYKIDEIEIEMNKLGNKYMYLSSSDEDKMTVFNSFKLLEYKKHFLTMLHELRYSDEKINMPLVIDSEGLAFSFGRNNQFEACTTLDPNIFFFYKVDGSTFNEDEKVPNTLIQEIAKVIIKKNKLNNYDKKKINILTNYSFDYKYLIVEIIPVKKNNNEMGKINEKRLIRNRAKYSK